MSESLTKIINKKEKIIAAVIIFIIVFISFIPLLFGYLTKGDNYLFGACFVNTVDYPTYLSLIEQSHQGRWLFNNLYTSEYQNPVFFSPLWLLLGKLNSLSGFNNVFWFHLARAVAAIGFLVVLYWLITKLFDRALVRLAALIFIGLSSGFGVLLALVGPWDVETIFYRLGADLWIPESNTFLSLYHSALFSLSQLLLVVIFYLFLSPLRRRGLLVLALLVLFLGILHPYDLITLGLVPLMYFLINWLLSGKIDQGKLKNYLVLLIFAALAGVYYLWLTHFDWVMADWARHNWTPSPPLTSYLIGYGLILPLALMGVVLVIKERQEKFYLFFAWVVSSGFLLYFPSNLQRRFSSGLHIALSILAMVALVRIFQAVRGQQKATLILSAILIFGLFVSNFSIISNDLVSSKHQDFSYSLPQGYYQAAAWLKDNTDQSQVVLAGVRDGNVIPALTGRKVFVGHSHQTADFINKRKLVEDWFFKTDDDDERKQRFLLITKVDFIWYGDKEKALGSFDPANKEYLQRVYSNEAVTIYRVLGADSGSSE